ncbi:hypothetical protein QAD02_000591 [Eretmocerus hayati]|uniref:Uncharacterized protein n=1 Tax=Eretmocerus hayati TaxID=131215 RepID=A0ACC2NDU8_9HYME|nr:hypothetical protein QAD02_000591 [Eretmocerus hayati]
MFRAPNCVVPNCGKKRDVNSAVMHRSFRKDPLLRAQWLEKCNISKSISPKSFVCSSHFCTSDYLPTGRNKRTLKPSAFPSLAIPRNDLTVSADPSTLQAEHIRFRPIHARAREPHGDNSVLESSSGEDTCGVFDVSLDELPNSAGLNCEELDHGHGCDESEGELAEDHGAGDDVLD